MMQTGVVSVSNCPMLAGARCDNKDRNTRLERKDLVPLTEDFASIQAGRLFEKQIGCQDQCL